MANVAEAIDYVLNRESDAVTSGFDSKRSRYGIREEFHPDMTNCLFFSSMGSVAAKQIARGIYELYYCDPLCIEQIANQELANCLLQLAMRVGVIEAGRQLQNVTHVAGDGRIGPLTLYALDYSDSAWLVEVLTHAKVAS